MHRVIISPDEVSKLQRMMKVSAQRITLANALIAYHKHGVTLEHISKVLGIKIRNVHAMISYKNYTCPVKHTRDAFTTYIRPDGRVQCKLCGNAIKRRWYRRQTRW